MDSPMGTRGRNHGHRCLRVRKGWRMRYRKLGYVALNVTDLDRSAAFYGGLLGLEPAGEVGAARAFRCSTNHHDVLLYRADMPGLKRIGWEMQGDAELAAARARFADAGFAPRPVAAGDCEALCQGESFRLTEPATGVTFEYYAAQRQPAAAWTPTVAKIQRLGHVVLNVQRFDQALASLTGDFGFVVSDRIADMVAFMRCFPNPFHHSLAVARSDANRLNHVNFMVSDIDDVGRAIYRMKAAGVPIVFGPGRHVPSESIFLYFLDPDGLTIEYSFGMEEFPEHDARAPRRLEPKLEILDCWGGQPTARMGAVGAIEIAA